jgi:hypothetical protein
MSDTPAQRLLPKLARIMELGNVINLSADRLLPIEIRAAIDEEQDRLEFRLRQLVEESKDREADLKLKSMERVVELLRTSNSNAIQ